MSEMNSQKLSEDIAALVTEHHQHVSAQLPFEPGVTPIAVSGKFIDEQEKIKMVEAALDGWLTTGHFNAEFETRLADYIGVKHLITVNSGSSAIWLRFTV